MCRVYLCMYVYRWFNVCTYIYIYLLDIVRNFKFILCCVEFEVILLHIENTIYIYMDYGFRK